MATVYLGRQVKLDDPFETTLHLMLDGRLAPCDLDPGR